MARKQIRVGIIGFGFIGPHHLDAIRRLGFADVTAIATTSLKEATAKAEQYQIGKAFGDWRHLIDAPDIDVVDIATPTHLHEPLALAAIEAGKHVIVDKPMAITSHQARRMLKAAQDAGVVHALTFNIRYNAMLQHARAIIGKGSLGDPRFIHGHYLQEWLLKDTDYNWRIDPEQSGPLAMVADAGAHWYDLAEHLTGLRIVRVLADFSTFIPIRRKPSKSGKTTRFDVSVPDLGMIMCEFENGARGLFNVSALCAGHKNDLSIEINGSQSSLRWQQERPNELWLGHRDDPNQTLQKDPPLLDPSIRHYAALPGGHNEAWPDAFRNLMRNILSFIASGTDPARADEIEFHTFSTGYRISHIVDAIAASARAGGRWKPVKN